jgi:hypothetical protein
MARDKTTNGARIRELADPALLPRVCTGGFMPPLEFASLRNSLANNIRNGYTFQNSYQHRKYI